MSGTDGRPAGLVRDDAELEQIASGFGFTEGPSWSDAGGYLVFSDIPGDAMWRWDESTGVSRYRSPSRMANGSTFDREGRLVTCEHATSRVVREQGDTIEVLADRYQGQELNSPNDVIVAGDGAIYFTDPTYGRAEYYGIPRPQQLAFQGVYRLTAAGALELLADDFAQPNGLCFSADESVLYVNDTDRMHIRAFDVGAGGRLSGGGVWAELTGDDPGGPDGMKLDSEGHVYCTGPGGIHVFDEDGARLGVVLSPELVGNFAWGDADRSTMFICASQSVYRLRTLVPGHVPG